VSYVDKNLLKGEKVIFRTKRHWITFVLPSLLAFIGILGVIVGIVSGEDGSNIAMAFFLVLIFIFPLVCAYFDYVSSEFTVTNKRVICKYGFLRKNSIEILLSKVESINVEQSLLGRFLNYGSITTGGTGATKNPFFRVSNPFLVRRHIQEQVDKLGGNIY
jgi:uncharacterized membrane protein YdbT with pleckstrin-like domain